MQPMELATSSVCRELHGVNPLLVDSFRRAIHASAWLKAEELLAALRVEIEHAWREGLSEPERPAFVQAVQQLLEWARKTASAGREHDRATLLMMPRESAYTTQYHGQGAEHEG